MGDVVERLDAQHEVVGPGQRRPAGVAHLEADPVRHPGIGRQLAGIGDGRVVGVEAVDRDRGEVTRDLHRRDAPAAADLGHPRGSRPEGGVHLGMVGASWR